MPVAMQAINLPSSLYSTRNLTDCIHREGGRYIQAGAFPSPFLLAVAHHTTTSETPVKKQNHSLFVTQEAQAIDLGGVEFGFKVKDTFDIPAEDNPDGLRSPRPLAYRVEFTDPPTTVPFPRDTEVRVQ